MVMDTKYKIVFSGEFKEWVEQEEFIHAISRHLKVSEKKAAALLEVDRRVTLKSNLSEAEATRHAAAFEKMGMLVTKRLMMKPFVGPLIERVSKKAVPGDGPPKLVQYEECEDEAEEVNVVRSGKLGLASIASGIKSLVNKGGA
jgi:hypothetical protein